MNNIIVGMGEALWDVVARRKENRWCSGKPLPIIVSQFWFDSRVVSAVGKMSWETRF